MAKATEEGYDANHDDEHDDTIIANDPWGPVVADWLATQPKDASDVDLLVTTSRVLAEALGVAVDRQNQTMAFRVQALLKGCRWTSVRRRCRGVVRRFWMPPSQG